MARISRYSSPAKGSSRRDGGEHQRAGEGAAAGGPHQRAVLGDRRRRRHGGRTAEEAVGANREDDRHDDELGDEGELREGDRDAADLDGAEHDAQRLGQSDQERREKGAGNRAQAADDGHDERLGDDGEVHPQVRRFARQLQGAREPGEAGAQREHQREQPRLVDPQRADQHPVLGGRPDQHAEPGARKQPPQATEHQRPDGDQQQLVGRHRAAEDVDDTGEPGRTRSQQVLGAPDRERRVADDEHQAEGRRELQELRRRVDPAQEQALDQRARRGDRHRRQHDAGPEAPVAPAEPLDGRPREVRAQHVQRAVREVDHAGDAEDQRQPRGHEEQR